MMEFVKCLNVILILFMLMLMPTYLCNNEIQLDTYLKFRYQDVKVKLAETFNKYYRKLQDTETNIVVHNRHTFFLPSIPVCFNMLNNTYILMHDQIFTLSITQDAYLFVPHSSLTEVKDTILFVKVMEFEQIIIAIATFRRGNSNVYIYEENNWILVQKIPKIGRIIDICLFIQDQNLYLFVVNDLKHDSVTSTLYKWSKVKFVESDKILTNGATSLSCFQDNNSEIIIVTQNPTHRINMIGTYVLESNNGKLRKKHFLNSFGASKVLSYILNGERYIIVLNNNFESTIYWWDAYYFMKWKKLKEPINYQQVSIFYVRNNPLLFAATKDTLIVYDLQTENTNIISKISYQQNYWKILSMDYALLDDHIVVYIIGLDEENYIQMLFVSVSFQTNQININSISDEDILLKCLKNLNEKLIFRSDLLSHMKLKSLKILQKNKDEIYKGIISSYQNVNVKNNVVHNKYSYSAYEQYLPVKDKLKQLKNQINNVNQQVQKLTGNITITGKLYVEELKVPSLQINKINNNIWDPSIWLLKSKSQIIYSPVTARSVFAKQIRTNNKNSDLNDLLLFQGNQILSGIFNFKNLIAQNIYVARINQIPFQMMSRRSNPTLVKGRKYLQNMSVAKIQSTTLNQKTTENVLHYLQNNIHFDFYYIKNLNIQNFNFDIINRVYWRDFSYSLFNTSRNNKIEGTVIIHSNIKINNLLTKRLSNINVNQIMTSCTEQTISSDMQLLNVNVENIKTLNVNGISFKEHAATFYDNSYVKGPITIQNIHVVGDVNGIKFPVQHFKDSNHLQMYDCHVKIIGNLTFNNVSLLDSTKLFYKHEQLPRNYIDDYWLKNQKQIIPVEVTALEGLAVKTLNTTYVNDKSFVLFSENYDQDVSFTYKFKNIRVNGDVVLHSNKNLKNIKKLLTQAVRKTGRFNITGQKIFKNVLNIQNLKTAVVDNVDMENLARVTKFNNFTGTKSFNKLIVQEYLILPENYKLKIRELNNFPIIDLLNRTIYIDRHSYVNNMIFKSIETSNIILKNLNNINVNEMTQKLIHLYTMDKIEKVFMHGSLDIKYLKTDKANDKTVDHYLSQVISIHDDIVIDGDITFKNQIFIDNLKTNRINDINLQETPKTYLSRTQDQVIISDYAIKIVKSPYIIVPEINNIKTNQFIDKTSTDDIHIYSSLEILTLSCISASTKFFNIDLQETFYGLDRLPGYEWTDVTVLKDINFYKVTGNFQRIISHAVNTLKNNTISKKVTFDYASAHKIELLQSKINGVNIKEIYNDALKNKAINQIVTGKNRFTRLSASRMKILGNTNIKNINGVNILKLNNTIIDKNHLGNSVVRGHKQFTNDVYITNLKVPSNIHGVMPEHLVELNKNYNITPNVRFRNVKIIEDCNFKYIKFVNVTQLILETLKRNANIPQYVSGSIYFKHIFFNGNVTTNRINNIDVKTVVTDNGIQNIHNSKKFYNSTNIIGDFNVELINGYRLSSIFNNAILTEIDALINNNVVFRKSIQIYANIRCSKINGVDITKIKSIIEDDTDFRNNVTIDAFHELKNIVDYYSKYIIVKTYD